MEGLLYTINDKNHQTINDSAKQHMLHELEEGKIIYLPKHYLSANNDEKQLLTENILAKGSKNISYDYSNSKISGVEKRNSLIMNMQQFMHKYALFSKHLVDTLLPYYSSNLIWGRTSFRPAEIKGRKTSKRKDDTRVHIDAFPATPVAGKRILRVFCNINPYGSPRVWHVGEPFHDLVQKFKNEIPEYSNFKAIILNLVKATKRKRTAYDHYMLNLHDRMKLNDDYQNTLDKKLIEFPANSTWIVYTDKVSHAALSGQFLLEQTFYLPAEHMHNASLAPLSYWK